LFDGKWRQRKTIKNDVLLKFASVSVWSDLEFELAKIDRRLGLLKNETAEQLI